MKCAAVRIGGMTGRLVGHLYMSMRRSALSGAVREVERATFRYDPGYVLSPLAVPIDPIALPLGFAEFSSPKQGLEGPLAAFRRRLPGGDSYPAIAYMREIYKRVGGVVPPTPSERAILDLCLCCERLNQWRTDGLYGLHFDGVDPHLGAGECPMLGEKHAIHGDQSLRVVREKNILPLRDSRASYLKNIYRAVYALKKINHEPMPADLAHYLVPSPHGPAVGIDAEDDMGEKPNYAAILAPVQQGYINQIPASAALSALAEACGIKSRSIVPIYQEDRPGRPGLIQCGALKGPDSGDNEGPPEGDSWRNAWGLDGERISMITVIPPYAQDHDAVERDANGETLTLIDSAGAYTDLRLPPCSSVVKWAEIVQSLGHTVDIRAVLKRVMFASAVGCLPLSTAPILARGRATGWGPYATIHWTLEPAEIEMNIVGVPHKAASAISMKWGGANELIARRLGVYGGVARSAAYEVTFGLRLWDQIAEQHKLKDERDGCRPALLDNVGTAAGAQRGRKVNKLVKEKSPAARKEKLCAQ